MINGKTQVYGIIGDPLSHVAAPELINKVFQAKAENKVLIPFHVLQPALESFINGLRHIKNFRGAVITMPHKTSIVKLLDIKTKELLQVNACNVVKCTEQGELIGTMLDGCILQFGV